MSVTIFYVFLNLFIDSVTPQTYIYKIKFCEKATNFLTKKSHTLNQKFCEKITNLDLFLEILSLSQNIKLK